MFKGVHERRLPCTIVAMLVCGLFVATGVWGQPISFKVRRDFVTGKGPAGIVAEDFNGDGNMDVAIINQENPALTGSVSIFLGDGRGNFQPPYNYEIGVNSQQIIVADFNGDNAPDLAVANEGSNDVSVLINDGGGDFRVTNYPVGMNPFALTAADFNGDGKADLAVANAGSSNVSLLYGNGTGGFATAQNFTVGSASQSSPRALVAGDFDGDDKLDIATANFGTNDISILMNEGGGAFGLARNINVQMGPRAIVTADFNNDNRLDLAVANYASNNITRLNGAGDGTFGGAATVALPAGTSLPRHLVAVDVNEDGNMDLIAVVSSSNQQIGVIAIYIGNGTGTLTLRPNPLQVGISPRAVAIADFNNDGKQDLAVVNYNLNTLSVIRGLGEGNFAVAPTFGTGGLPSDVVVFDINGDGFLDIITANANGNNLSRYFGDGNGGFASNPPGYVVQPPARPAFPRDLNVLGGANGAAAIAVTHFSSGNRTDLVVANRASNNISKLIGSPLTPPGQLTGFTGTNSGVQNAPNGVIAIDIDGNGWPDVATVNQLANSVSLLMSNDQGTGFMPVINIPNLGIQPVAITVGDFNKDGYPDLAVVSAFSGVTPPVISILMNNFEQPTYFNPPRQIEYLRDSFPSSITTDDVDLDGKLDLIVANAALNSVSVLLGNGDGTFQAPVHYPVGASPVFVRTADLDGDNVPDLVVVNQTGNYVSILMGVNEAPGTFAEAIHFGTGNSPRAVAISDLNRDGKLDLVITDGLHNQISVLMQE
jgi:hypothetical protein